MSDLFGNLIGGQWLIGSKSIENINPSDIADVIGHYSQAGSGELAMAIAEARQARGIWREFGLEKRQESLDRIGREMMARAEELGRMLSREEGKPLAEGRGEVYRAGQFFTYYAAEVLRQLGENADSVRPGIEIDIRREPVGVVAVISPWNFPVATASWKIAPALAFGNCVIWKPANQTPASAWALAEIISRSGIPDGAFQLLMGPGATLGYELACHPGIDAVSFTGSLAVGRQVAQATAANLNRCQLELGSKNALLVMEDGDLDLAVQAAVVGAYSGSGQKCTASSRLLVHSTVHDEFVEKLSAQLSAMKVGNALSEGTQIGPVISASQLKSNLDWIEQATKSGAAIATGNKTPETGFNGHYMAPVLLTGTTNQMDFNREELFAPIAAVQLIHSYEEGLDVVNDTDYGLVAGIFTRSLARATHFRRNVETGCVTINLPTAGTDYHVPFGGRKNSNLGPREQGRAAVEFYTHVKTAYIRSGEPE